MPFIVRVETGTVDRGIYQTAVLFDPTKEKVPTPVVPPKGWNRGFFSDPSMDEWIETARRTLAASAHDLLSASLPNSTQRNPWTER